MYRKIWLRRCYVWFIVDHKIDRWSTLNHRSQHQYWLLLIIGDFLNARYCKVAVIDDQKRYCTVAAITLDLDWVSEWYNEAWNYGIRELHFKLNCNLNLLLVMFIYIFICQSQSELQCWIWCNRYMLVSVNISYLRISLQISLLSSDISSDIFQISLLSSDILQFANNNIKTFRIYFYCCITDNARHYWYQYEKVDINTCLKTTVCHVYLRSLDNRTLIRNLFSWLLINWNLWLTFSGSHLGERCFGSRIKQTDTRFNW